MVHGHALVMLDWLKLETAQQMANHESACTTGPYDRRNDRVGLDAGERTLI